jgi:hypothetical protein
VHAPSAEGFHSCSFDYGVGHISTIAMFPEFPLRSRTVGYPQSDSELSFPAVAFPQCEVEVLTHIHLFTQKGCPSADVLHILTRQSTRPSAARTGRRMITSFCGFTTPMIIPSHALAVPRGGRPCAAPPGEATCARADDGSACVRSRSHHRGRSPTRRSRCQSPRTCHGLLLPGEGGYPTHRWSAPAGQTLLGYRVVLAWPRSHSAAETQALEHRPLLGDVLGRSTPSRIAAFVRREPLVLSRVIQDSPSSPHFRLSVVQACLC